MPWREASVNSERCEFSRLAEAGELSMAELCRRFGISRPTGYLWLERWRQEGDAGLEDRSHRPHSFPQRMPRRIEKKVVKLRRKHPRWGGRKISAVLARSGVTPVPAPSTVTGILRRHGLLGEAPPPRDYVRFEAQVPNDLWQMDFKGWFSVADGGRCHPFGVLDDHSRFNLVLAACADQRTATVQYLLTGAFSRYGLPQRILCDNGPPWGNNLHQPWTPLGVWLVDVGIKVIHSRPYHPQTAGKQERFHLTLDWEVISTRKVWVNHQQVQAAFDQWRPIYNHQRPHDALELAVPADRYRLSPRPYPDQVAPIEPDAYPDTYQVRKVTDARLSYHGHLIRVPKAFNGRYVALTPPGTDGTTEIRYRHQIITTIQLPTP